MSTWCHEVDELDSADVVVVGGGTAGFVAAVAAARQGASVVLLEAGQFLGGSLTGTYVSSPNAFWDGAGNRIIGGIAWEVIERLQQRNMAVVDEKAQRVQIWPEAVKDLALEMVEEAGVRLHLYSSAALVQCEEGVSRRALVQTRNGQKSVTGRVWIDASGDGVLAAMAGAGFEEPPRGEVWQTSVDLTVANIDAGQVVEWAKGHADVAFSPELDYGHVDKIIQPMFTLLFPNQETSLVEGGMVHRGPMPTVKLMIQRSVGRVQGSVEIDPTDPVQVTRAETEGRKRAHQHLEFLRQNVTGFEHAIVVGESFLGVRESRRVIGEYRLTLDDLRSNARFPDVVLLNARPLDRHLAGERFELYMLSGNHDVPYRALLPRGVANLLVAGKCLSCDHDAHASLRGAATCMAMGHAAGTAAAMAAQLGGEVRAVPVPELQRRLREQGAILTTDAGASR